MAAWQSSTHCKIGESDNTRCLAVCCAKMAAARAYIPPAADALSQACPAGLGLAAHGPGRKQICSAMRECLCCICHVCGLWQSTPYYILLTTP